METMRVLLLGDIVGATGRAVFAKHIAKLREKHGIHAVIVNGENSSDQGRGITPKIAEFFREHGVDCITTGNHVWFRNEIYSYLDEHRSVLRPANFPAGAPGVGVATFQVHNKMMAVVNIQGRVFMKEQVDDPLRTMDSILAYLKDKTPIIFVDFHAEATSEKHAMAYYCAGRVSGVVGTHTHVQTADERILPEGTAYITDLGMAGSLNSMLGMQKTQIIQHFLTQLPVKFMVDTQPPFVLSGVIIDVDAATGRAKKIERVRVIDNELTL
jgi:metallophosphoesterase (TIGR00282 family)